VFNCTKALPFLLISLVISALLGWLAVTQALAGEVEGSSFGAVTIPQPDKPDNANACVEPVEVMRREHMNLLLHQRDATVLDGERDGKYSLVGCMDCHNPAESAETAIRYPDPQHFCAGCHLYTSVQIDCFECHADRGLGNIQQGELAGQLKVSSEAQPGSDLLSLQTFQTHLGDDSVD
jgi:predicted CXXCH cytochrome family protein